MKKTKWGKKCPECGKVLYYTRKYSRDRAEKLGSICNSCVAKKRFYSEETKKKMSESTQGEKNPMFGKRGENSPNFGQKRSEEVKKLIGEANSRRKWSEESRQKAKKSGRLRRIREIEENDGQMMPNYNKNAVSIIEQKAKELGITDLQHAENGGEFHIKELGYWVDGRSKEKNIVIEYYENWHKEKSERDERRKKEIIEHLGCEFIEIKEWEK